MGDYCINAGVGGGGWLDQDGSSGVERRDETLEIF